jgi:hypothetical protein
MLLCRNYYIDRHQRDRFDGRGHPFINIYQMVFFFRGQQSFTERRLQYGHVYTLTDRKNVNKSKKRISEESAEKNQLRYVGHDPVLLDTTISIVIQAIIDLP